MGEELGVGGVQVRVPSRRRIALTSGRCHRTRAAGARPVLAANLVCARVSNSSLLSYPPIVAQIAGHLGGIDGSHHADRNGDAACVPRTRIVDVAGRPRRRVITSPAPRAHRATQTRDARLAKWQWHRPRPSTVRGCGARAPGLELDRTHARARGKRALAPGVARVDPGRGRVDVRSQSRSPRRSQRDDDADVRSRVEGRATRDAGRRRGTHSIHRRSHPACPRVHRPTLPPPQPLLPRAARREHPRRPRPVPLQSIVQIRHNLRLDQKRHLPDARSGAHHRRRVRRRALLAVHQQLPKSLPIRAHTPRRPRVAVQSAQDGVLGAARSAQDGRARL